MLVCPVDAEMLSECEATALARNVELWQRVAPETPLLFGTWTAHDTAAHLVAMVGRYLKPNRRLATGPRDVDLINKEELQELESATMGELTGRLRSRYAKYLAFWAGLPLEMVLPIRDDLPLDVASLRTNWITELLIHGRDMALAAGDEWPLDDTSCLLAMRLLAQALPGYLRNVGPIDYTLAIAPAGGLPFSVVIRGGTTEVQPTAVDGADRLSGSPSALVLLFSGRIDLAEALATGVTLTGDAGRVQALLDKQDRP
ncbi:MAG: hypothetical protein ACTHK4_17090 [Mycobacteriales bacterium]